MSNCEINIIDGKLVSNKHPSLMNEILSYTDGNIDKTLDLYGVTFDNDFINMNIGKPNLENILNYIEEKNIIESSELNKSELDVLLKIGLQENKIDNFREKYINSFNVNGKFGINANLIKENGLFTDQDILEMNDVEILNTLKKLYYKLNKTDEELKSIQSNTILKNSIFDKQNPDEFVQNSYDIYLGVTNQDEILKIANENNDEDILSNPELIPQILNIVQGKERYIQYEVNEQTGDIVMKAVDDTSMNLKQTLDISQDFAPILYQIDFIKNLSKNDYVTELPLVSNYLSNIEKQLNELGINVKDLASTIEGTSYEKTRDFLDNLYNFLYDLQYPNDMESLQENIENFSNNYNEFFNKQPQLGTTIQDKINKKGVYLHLESQLSEEELFNKNSIIKIKDNIYRKISDNKTLDDLYQIISRTGLMKKQDIENVISNRAKEYLTENSDPEIIKKIVAYKILTKTEDVQEENIQKGIEKLDTDMFLIDFNKELLKNPNIENMFYFSNRGLETKGYIGEYSTQVVKNSLPQSLFNRLVLYSKLSGNESLSAFTSFNNDIIDENKRDYYANNLKKLPIFANNFYNDNGYIVANSDQDFIRINNELYENVAPNVYAKVGRNERYLNYGLKKPKYDNSVTPYIKTDESNKKVSVDKTNNIENQEITFC